MTDFIIRRERESVCNNNCEPIHSVVETLTNATTQTSQNNNETPLKSKSKTMIFTIVGIRNYLPNGEADYPTLFSRLPIGTTVYLKKQPTGSPYPGSISVWDDECNQIGSISKIERRFIELDVPQNGMLPVKVSGHSAEHNCMYFEAENKNGFKDPYIREVELGEGETTFPMAKQDDDLQTLTAFMITMLKGLKNKDTVSDHFLSTANTYAQICCSSLDGETSFSRGNIMFEMQQHREKFQQLDPIYDEIFEKNKDIGRKYNDIKTEVYRSQYERIKQMALGKDKNGISPLDSYIKNLKFKNGDQLTPEIINSEIVHLSDLLSKEFYGTYYQNVECDEDFATALYSLNYSMKAIYRLFTRRIKLDYLKEIKKHLVSDSKTMPADTENEKKQRGPQKQVLFINGKSTKENVQAKNREKQRFLHYLSEHNYSKQCLNCNKEDELNDIITCFLKIWHDKKLIADSPSGAAIFRFLTEECQLKSDVTEQSYSNKIKERLRNNTYTPKRMKEVSSAFN